MSLSTLTQIWNDFFHLPEPSATIAVFRILFGILLTANVLLLFRESSFWLGPDGVLSTSWYRRQFGNSRFNLLNYLPPTQGSVRLVLSLQLLSALLLTVGLFTRTSAAIAFVTLVTIHHRNPMITHSGDSLLRLMTFLLIFSQAGQSLSLDRAFNPQDASGTLSSPWCTRLMQLQIAVLYLRTASGKLRGSTWRDGTAAFYPTQSIEYRRFAPPAVLVRPTTIRLATWVTLAVEFSLATLIWIDETRYPVLLAGLALHLTLEYLMNLQLLGWTAIVCLVLFVDSYDLHAVLLAVPLIRPGLL